MGEVRPSPEKIVLGEVLLFSEELYNNKKISREEWQLYEQLLFLQPDIVGGWEKHRASFEPGVLEAWFILMMQKLTDSYIAKFIQKQAPDFIDPRDEDSLINNLTHPLIRKRMIEIVNLYYRGETQAADKRFNELYHSDFIKGRLRKNRNGLK